jgi:ABC-type bacteriocin/lantibiotic exporter with double-glycine peptidase domain
MRRYECVLQDGPKDCGVCSLLTIIKTRGGLVTKEYLRNLTNTTSNGVNALSLLEAGKKLGFYTQGVKGDVLKIISTFAFENRLTRHHPSFEGLFAGNITIINQQISQL